MHALHGNGKTGRLLREVNFRLHNVCGLRDDAFRRSYLRSALCDVLALLETNCASADEETLWSQDWQGQSFWASQYRDPSTQSLGSHRGVAIFLRELPSVFGVGRVIPGGRDEDTVASSLC